MASTETFARAIEGAPLSVDRVGDQHSQPVLQPVADEDFEGVFFVTTHPNYHDLAIKASLGNGNGIVHEYSNGHAPVEK